MPCSIRSIEQQWRECFADPGGQQQPSFLPLPWHPSQLVVRCLAVRDRASSIPIALLVDYYLLGICTAHHSTFRTRDLHRVLDYNFPICISHKNSKNYFALRHRDNMLRIIGSCSWSDCAPDELLLVVADRIRQEFDICLKSCEAENSKNYFALQHRDNMLGIIGSCSWMDSAPEELLLVVAARIRQVFDVCLKSCEAENSKNYFALQHRYSMLGIIGSCC